MTPFLSEIELFFKSRLIDLNHPLIGEMRFDTQNWQRFDCPSSPKGNQNVAYRAHSDGTPVLKIQCNKCHEKPMTFKYQEHVQLSPKQRQEIQLQCKKREATQQEQREAALKTMQIEWNNSSPCITHPYFDFKGLNITEADGLKLDSYGRVLCPITLISGELVSTQTIPLKGKKKFRSGLSPKNGFHVFGSIDVHDEIFFAEGIATALTIREAVNKCVICVYGKHFSDIAPIIAKVYPNKKLTYCCDLPSEGEKVTSESNARKAIALVGGNLFKPDFSMIPTDLRPDVNRSDFNDLYVLLRAKGFETTAALDIVRQQIEKPTRESCMTDDNQTQKQDLHIEVKRLALLDKIEYELLRDQIAKQFAIRSGKLDEFVDDERKKTEAAKSESILFPNIEPWPDSVNLPELLDRTVQLLNSYVSFNSEHEPIAISLWVIHTYCIDAAYISPLLFVTSAEMRSGKSTLLSIIQKIAYKCVAASSVSPSAIYRLIPKHRPTFIFDEADTYLNDKNEDLRCVLNAGHSRDTSGVLRTNGDTMEVERFDAFAAKCIAAIKRLPNTVEDRSIIIKMKRMEKGHKKEKMRMINEHIRKTFYDIQRMCLRFANDNLNKLKLSNKLPPDELHDRAADNWFSLLQISSLADDKWHANAKKAALYLSGVEQECKSLGMELLEDIQNLLDGKFKYDNAVKTADLLEALCSDEEAPWATYNSKRQDSKINSKQLANLLAPYGIKSTKNLGQKKERGYLKTNFQDAFNRYVSTETPDFNSPEHEHLARDIFPHGADSGYSASERIKTNTKNTTEAPPHMARADRADKSANLGGQDYIDV